MAFDLLSLVVGVVLGGLAVGIVVEAMGRNKDQVVEQEKLTTAWRLREMREPIIVARDVMDVEVPAGCKIFASGLVDPRLQETCQVREVPPVRAEFALDLQSQRAFLFVAGLHKDAMAMVTVDEPTVRRLETEYRRLADRSSEYVERVRIQDLGGRDGVTVETEGFVQDVLPWKEQFMLRLEDQGHIIGVAVGKDPSQLKDRRIRVKGRLGRDQTGYAIIEANEIRPIG